MALPIWQRTITTEAGDIVPGAEVEVVNEATGLPADIFSDREGNTERSNPFFATSKGFAQFYAAPGEYRITATGPSGSQTWRWNVLPGTAAAQDVEAWRSTVTVTGNHTVESPPAYGTSIVNVNAATATITIPEGVPIGGRIHVRKIHETQGAVTIQFSGSDTVTRANLSSVTLNAQDDNWVIERVTGTRSVLVAGVESGENGDGFWTLNPDGTAKQIKRGPSRFDQAFSDRLDYRFIYPRSGMVAGTGIVAVELSNDAARFSDTSFRLQVSYSGIQFNNTGGSETDLILRLTGSIAGSEDFIEATGISIDCRWYD